MCVSSSILIGLSQCLWLFYSFRTVMSGKLAFKVALKRIIELRVNRMALCLDDIRILATTNV